MARPWSKAELDKNMRHQEDYLQRRKKEMETGAKVAPGLSGKTANLSKLNRALTGVAKTAKATVPETPDEAQKKKKFSRALARIMDYKAGAHD